MPSLHTERIPVDRRSKTHGEHPCRRVRGVEAVCLLIVLGMVLGMVGPSVVHAQALVPTRAYPAPRAAPAADGTVAQALEAGDLSAALEHARSARMANPSAEHWLQEARVLDRMGNVHAASDAYRSYLAALPKDAPPDARTSAQQRIRALDQLARGTRVDEPASTHRSELDKRWAPPPVAKKRSPVPPPPTQSAEHRIVRKWYFWVTLGAIVASSVAITVIAIKAATGEQADALDRSAMGGPLLLRF